MASGVSNSQPSMHQPGPQQDVGGLLQNLSNVTSLLQQQGIAQQLLAAAQQVSSGASMAQPQQQVLSMLSQGSQQPLGGSGMTGSGAMGHGAGGGYVSEPYNPAAVGPSSSLQQQPRQQMGSMMGGGGGSLMPQQQQPMQHFHEPAMQQGGAGYMGGPPMQQQPMMQGPPQQQYGMGPQVQPQMMQPSMGPVCCNLRYRLRSAAGLPWPGCCPVDLRTVLNAVYVPNMCKTCMVSALMHRRVVTWCRLSSHR